MKATIIIISLMTTLVLNAQSQTQIGFHYKIKNNYRPFLFSHSVNYSINYYFTDTIRNTISSAKVYVMDNNSSGIIKVKSQLNQKIDSIIKIDDLPLNKIVQFQRLLSKATGDIEITKIFRRGYQRYCYDDTLVIKKRNKTDSIIVFSHGGSPVSLCSKRLKADVFPDTSKKKGILNINFWGITSELCSCVADSIVNSTDSLGQFYYQIIPQTTLSDVRNYISLPFTNLELGIVTVPFKYHFSYQEKNGSIVPNNVAASVDGGIYMGRKIGRTRFFENKALNNNSMAFTSAFFLSPMVISIDSESTLGEIKTKSSELACSVGAALLISKQNINVGILVGGDFPLSRHGAYWEYARRPWIGFGIGYKLAILGETSGAK